MDWHTAGDLFFYMDTKAGGADSTMTDWNGASVDTASAFDTEGDFKPHFCLAVDSLGSRFKLMYWNGTAWAESIGTYPSTNYSLDTINDTYTTVARVLRSKIGNPATLKLLVLHLQETSDYCYRSFPIINPNGGKGATARMDGLPTIAFPYRRHGDPGGDRREPGADRPHHSFRAALPLRGRLSCKHQCAAHHQSLGMSKKAL